MTEIMTLAIYSVTEINREKTFRRQTTFVRHHTSGPLVKNSFLIWVVGTKLFFLLF
jgi:hypothetical protein